jgi:transcriptional regulator with XRE-family HTH domain
MDPEFLSLLRNIKDPHARTVAVSAFAQSADVDTELLAQLREEAWSSPLTVRMTLALLHQAKGWNNRELAKLLGVSPIHLAEIELGRRPLSREDLERVAAAKGLTTAQLNEVLLLSHSMNLYLETAWEGHWQESFAPLSPADRRALILEDKNFRNWGLGEMVCAKSKAAEDLDEAVTLAELALFIAENLPHAEGIRRRHQGYAWGHLGHALKRRGNQAAAEAAFEECIQRWTSGQDSGGADRADAEHLAAIVPSFPPYEPPPRRPSLRKKAPKKAPKKARKT